MRGLVGRGRKPITDGTAAVQEWVRQFLANPDELVLEEMHVDELTAAYAPSRSVRTTLRLYDVLLSETAGVASTIMALAIFPLGYSRDLVLDRPDPNDLQPVVDPCEPPSLYVMTRRARLYLRTGEEYLAYLPQDVVVPPPGVVRAVYYVFRNQEGDERGWEFARSVNFEHYTPDLVVPP